MLDHYIDLALQMDSRLLMALRVYTHCRFLDLTMPWVTYLGDGLVLFILCIATYHATVIFALAQVYGLEYRKLRLLFLALATLVGFSRIYVGMHFPGDVLAGIVMGLTVATFLLNHEKSVKQRRQGRQESDAGHC